jgi:hypothetical protein
MTKLKETQIIAEEGSGMTQSVSRPEKVKLGRGRRIWRKALIWMVIVAISFLIGLTAYHFVRYIPLTEALKETQSDLNAAEVHLELLRGLTDVSNARIALFMDDVDSAKAALANMPQRLDNLASVINEYDDSLAKDMQERLGLIVSGLDRDVETAKIDLELLTKDLLNIEAIIFGQ